MKTKAKVRFYGQDIVYQFSRRGGGSRTRTATVTNIKKATKRTLALLRAREMEWYDPHRSKTGEKSPDSITLHAEILGVPIYEGVAAWRFKGESPRFVRVVGVVTSRRNIGKLPERWSSIKFLDM